jgi:hypothetical protein
MTALVIFNLNENRNPKQTGSKYLSNMYVLQNKTHTEEASSVT